MELDTLNDSSWDVVIAGTGIYESLLALALSRSGKKILHIDKNSYYGGSAAALSLQDAKEWAQRFSSPAPRSSFANASFTNQTLPSGDSSNNAPQLAFSRAYSLALAPQIIYTQSTLLPALVSSRVDSQLEFLAVGNFFVFDPSPGKNEESSEAIVPGSLFRVPSSREDVFADTSLAPRDKRGLMKFIKYVVGLEDRSDISDADEQLPLDQFLSTHFNLSTAVQRPVHALTLSLSPPNTTQTKLSLARIARHLTSIGVFGPGFGSVIPKWGGLAEITQVGCRACAVGGGVYVLGNGINSVEKIKQPEDTAPENRENRWRVHLEKGESISTDWLVSGHDNLTIEQLEALDFAQVASNESEPSIISHLVAIVSSPLENLFQPTVDGAPIPAVAIVQLPDSQMFSSSTGESKPVYIRIHSSDTGECPAGQSILYCSVTCEAKTGYEILSKAAKALLETVNSDSAPQILCKLEYEQHVHKSNAESGTSANSEPPRTAVIFPTPSMDLAYNDEILRKVRNAWQKIMGDEADDFMMFPPREPLGGEDDE